MTTREGMFRAIGRNGCEAINVSIEYKGFTISIAFDNNPCAKKKDDGGYLHRTEIIIFKGDKNVTYLFYEHLKKVVCEEDCDCLNVISEINLDELMFIKAKIDTGYVDFISERCDYDEMEKIYAREEMGLSYKGTGSIEDSEAMELTEY